MDCKCARWRVIWTRFWRLGENGSRALVLPWSPDRETIRRDREEAWGIGRTTSQRFEGIFKTVCREKTALILLMEPIWLSLARNSVLLGICFTFFWAVCLLFKGVGGEWELYLFLYEFHGMSSRVFPSIARQLARGGRTLSQSLYHSLFSFIYKSSTTETKCSIRNDEEKS